MAVTVSACGAVSEILFLLINFFNYSFTLRLKERNFEIALRLFYVDLVSLFTW